MKITNVLIVGASPDRTNRIRWVLAYDTLINISKADLALEMN